MALNNHYDENKRKLNTILRVDSSFDLIERPLIIAGRKASLYLIDGFVKEEIMEKIIEFFFSIKPKELSQARTAQEFTDRFISYTDIGIQNDEQKIATAVLSGTIALIIDGYQEAVMIDARVYPIRSVEEPEDDRVLRGSRDGFVETLVFNTSLIRRRIRDTSLTMELVSVGKRSKTDVILCYLENKADLTLVKRLKQRLSELDINSLTMCQESIVEALINRRWWNPFPKVRYTERPDVASSAILEGKVILIVDNSPAVMMLPTTIFDFSQESNDFYFPPVVGTYLRLVRIFIFLTTLFFTPIWYLLVKNPQFLPPWLEFIQISDAVNIPIIIQLLLIEVAIDGLKMASLNTPPALSNSFSVIGALILGEFAVEAGWLAPEIIFYMAFVAIANFTQPSFELGYAFKLNRMLLLLLIFLFNLWGFIAGLVILVLQLVLNRTVSGKSYLYPLIPFNGKELAAVFIRRRIHKDNS